MPNQTEAEQYHELCAWSLSRRDGGFVHQFVVDCWALQHATTETKPMSVVFALVSLCLHLEHGQTGRQAQLAHMKMARHKKEWPLMPLPKATVDFSVKQIFDLKTDVERDCAIDRWCALTWEAWKGSQQAIREMVHRELDIA